MNILITGGAGYIGSSLANFLNKLNYNIIIYDDLIDTTTKFIGDFTFIKGNINDTIKLRTLFSNHTIDIVIHTAALTNVGESFVNVDGYYYNNVMSTINLLNIMKCFQTKYLIFSSSCSIYGDDNSPISPYANTKLICETAIKDYANKYKFQYIIFRYFNVAGAVPEENIGECHISGEKRIIPVIINKCLNNETLSINGKDLDTKDGTIVRDYIHIKDLLNAHLSAVNYLLATTESHTIDLGSGVGTSLLEIVSITEGIISRRMNVTFKEKKTGDPEKVISDCTKCKEILKSDTKCSIHDIIESTCKWIIHLKQ